MWISLLPLAWAWDVNGVSWTWQDDPIEDTFHIDAPSFPADAGGSAQVEAAITGAMDTWTKQGYNLALRYEPGGGSVLDYEGLFYVFYTSAYVTDTALAFTAGWSYDDGQSFDCDIVYMEQNSYGAILWDANPAGPASGRYGVGPVALHEAGHCLGFGHSDRSDAVMYAYYNGVSSPSADDLTALSTLYGAPCADGDGDGYSLCEGDCDDNNALIHPGAVEVCDGVDGDCDGVVDQQSERAVELGRLATRAGVSWTNIGNSFRVDEPTALVSASMHLLTSEGARLIWSVSVADSAAGPWERVRSEIAYASASDWQESPRLDIPLEQGRFYTVSVGVISAGTTVWADKSPSFDPEGPITPSGAVYGRALGDDLGAADTAYMMEQTLVLIDLQDPDGDGQTGLCGDCAPDDASQFQGNPELCDGLDQDCDGEIDEDFASDQDADGVYDCADPCPEDSLDDQDGDGACDGADPCPEDPADTCEELQDSPACEDCDSGLGGEVPPPKGRCASAEGGRGALLFGLLLALLRRQRAQTGP